MTTLKLKPFDAAEYLDTDEAIAVFLADALESGDDAVFQEALQTAARARGMSDIAKDAGLGRESLYKALQPGAQPRFSTVRKVMGALGVTITIATSKPSSKRVPAKRRTKPSGETIRLKTKAPKPARARAAS